MSLMNFAKNISKILIALLILASCRGTEKTEDASSGTGAGDDASKGSDTPGVPDAAAGFNVAVQPDSKYSYIIHKGTGLTTDNWDTPCRIDSTAVGPDRDITCVIEAPELDIHFHGIGIRFNVPPDMCNYVMRKLPYFYKFLPGTGAITVTDNRAGTAMNGGVAQGTISPYLTCPYDYTLAKGPNCCEGSYTLNTWTDDPDNVPDKLTVTQKEWGGKASSCLAGPASVIGPFSPTNSFPIPLVHFIEGVGINIGYFLDPPIGKQYSNMYVTNYYNPADHVPGRPLSTTAAGFANTNLYHEFLCLNREMEQLASIKVMVREWNTDAELLLKAAGNSDVLGIEGIGTPLNDFIDFKDLGEAYIGLGM